MDSGAYMSSLWRGGEKVRLRQQRTPEFVSHARLTGWLEKNALDAEVEVELPRGHVLWVVPVLVRDGEADLDDLQQVDVTPHGLVVVVGGGLERPYWPGYDARKLGVLRSTPLV